MVVLEAFAVGLPVVCLDLGGPGHLARPDCAFVIPARQAGESAIIDGLAQAMIRLATDPGFRAHLADNAINRAKQLTWDRAAENLYASVDSPPRP
jgi:glycosyltransferase involved in cell wall biosynthesis